MVLVMVTCVVGNSEIGIKENVVMCNGRKCVIWWWWF